MGKEEVIVVHMVLEEKSDGKSTIMIKFNSFDEVVSIKEVDLKEIIEQALDKLYNSDYDLIDFGSSERSIVFRLGLYINQLIKNNNNLKEWNVDCEYNRSGYDKKICCGKIRFPDLIIHKRAEKKNLLIIECKKSKTGKDKDIKKLSDFLNSKDYRYQYAIFIQFKKERNITELEWVNKNGVIYHVGQ